MRHWYTYTICRIVELVVSTDKCTNTEIFKYKNLQLKNCCLIYFKNVSHSSVINCYFRTHKPKLDSKRGYTDHSYRDQINDLMISSHYNNFNWQHYYRRRKFKEEFYRRWYKSIKLVWDIVFFLFGKFWLGLQYNIIKSVDIRNNSIKFKKELTCIPKTLLFLHLGDITKQTFREEMLTTEDSKIKDGERQTKNKFRYRRNRRLRLVSPYKRSFNKGITTDNTSQNSP